MPADLDPAGTRRGGEPSIAVLGGTGRQGSGLAYRFARAGHRVVIGSRSLHRARATCAGLQALPRVPAGALRPAANADAAVSGPVVVAALPYPELAAELAGLRRELAGRVVLVCANPLGWDRAGAHRIPVPEGSAAESAARVLPGSRVVAACHHLSHVELRDPSRESIDAAVPVVGDDEAAVALIVALLRQIPGLRPVGAGPLRVSRTLEARTPGLIGTRGTPPRTEPYELWF